MIFYTKKSMINRNNIQQYLINHNFKSIDYTGIVENFILYCNKQNSIKLFIDMEHYIHTHFLLFKKFCTEEKELIK
jgi:hypothetical protein